MSTTFSIPTIIAAGLTWTCSLLWSNAAQAWIDKNFPTDKNKALTAQIWVAVIFTVLTILAIVVVVKVVNSIPSFKRLQVSV